MLEKLENIILPYVLVAVAIISLASNLLTSFPFPTGWENSLIFLTLYYIIRLLQKGEPTARFEYLPTTSATYKQAAHLVHSAREKVDVCYFRRVPPSEMASREAVRYFESVLEWARRGSDSGSRLLRRMIWIPDEGRMLAWAHQHHEETKDIKNYEVRVVEWGDISAPLNIAIIDGEFTLLAISGSMEQELRSCVLESPKLASTFLEYYTELWNKGTPLKDYIAVHPLGPESMPRSVV